MRIMTDEEAFQIHHLQDQQRAISLFSKYQNLPEKSSDNRQMSLKSIIIEAFLASMMNIFDYLLHQECIYCDVCSLMPPAGRVLRRLELQRTSDDLLIQIVHLEASLYENKASIYSQQMFCQYFYEKRHETHRNLKKQVKDIERNVIYLPGNSIQKLINPKVTFNSIDGMEIKLRKYEKAKQEVIAKREETIAKIKKELRTQWEDLKLISSCNSSQTNANIIELDAKLLRIHVEKTIAKLAMKIDYEAEMAVLKQKLFPPEVLQPVLIQEKPAIDLNAQKMPALVYQSLLPVNWEPKKDKNGKKHLKK